jgi:hypothetical protein
MEKGAASSRYPLEERVFEVLTWVGSRAIETIPSAKSSFPYSEIFHKFKLQEV